LDFGVQGGIVDGPALCRMLDRAIRGQTTPKYLSTDINPLYRFLQWQAASQPGVSVRLVMVMKDLVGSVAECYRDFMSTMRLVCERLPFHGGPPSSANR
jgi:hypothetical protein